MRFQDTGMIGRHQQRIVLALMCQPPTRRSLATAEVDICLIRAICNYFTGATGLCLAEVDGVDYRKSFSSLGQNGDQGKMTRRNWMRLVSQ